MADRIDPFAVTRVYTGEDGETHLEQTGVELEQRGGVSALSELVEATGVIFRRTSPDLFADWHPAPRRQYVVTLAGEGEIEVSDGSILPLGPGSVVLVEDVDGVGHITRGRGKEDRLSLFIPLPDE
jgi:hypothetical protein